MAGCDKLIHRGNRTVADIIPTWPIFRRGLLKEFEFFNQMTSAIFGAGV